MVSATRPWIAYDDEGYPSWEEHVYDPAAFPWVKTIESQWATIRDELQSVLDSQDDVLEPYPDQNKTNRRHAWRTAGLMYWSFGSRKYQTMFPRTWAILKDIPDLTSASVLLLEPRSTIKPHIGDTNAMVRCHMGLIVPASAPRCGLRVKDTTLSWEHGRIFMFNDAHEHTAWNNTDQNRYILSFDVMRPEFRKRRQWVSCWVLANIFYDIRCQRYPRLARLMNGKRRERAGRLLSFAMLRSMAAFRLPLFNLF